MSRLLNNVVIKSVQTIFATELQENVFLPPNFWIYRKMLT